MECLVDHDQAICQEKSKEIIITAVYANDGKTFQQLMQEILNLMLSKNFLQS